VTAFSSLLRRVGGLGHWLAAPQGQVLDEAIPFQTDIEEIIVERPPRYLRSAHYFVMLLFVSLVVIAAIRRVDVVVVGSGRIESDSPPIVLQPLEHAIIRQMNVKSGDMVTKGELLATLDPTFTQADYKTLSAQQRSVLAQIRGLEAILNNKPLDLNGVTSQDDQLQMSLYRQRQAQYQSRVGAFDEDILRLEASLRSAEDDHASLAKQLEVARDIETMRATLMKLETGSKLQYLDAQSVRMRVERDYEDTSHRLIETQHDIAAKQAERQAFIDEWRRQFIENLVTARNEASHLGEDLAKATRMNDLVVITAPEDGMVLDVAQRSVGSVLQSGEALVTMMPTNANLIAAITIASGDVGYTKPGDEVVIKVDAFPYQRHGMLKGTLLSVSEESFATGAQSQNSAFSAAGRSAAHRGWVRLDSTYLRNMPEGAHLIPGMTLNAEIKIGTRSLISFFTSPITQSLGESVREP
jgi:HlyD family secretion protein